MNRILKANKWMKRVRKKSVALALYSLDNSNFVYMKFIFLIAAFNAFFFTVLLFQKKPGALHDI